MNLSVRVEREAKNKSKRQRLEWIPFEPLLWGSLGLLGLDLIIRGSLTSLVGTSCWLMITGSYLLICDAPNKHLSQLQQWVKKHGVRPLVGLMGFIVLWVDWLIQPATAQFLNNAQTFFEDNLTNGNADFQAPISLLFNVIRGLLVIYIAVALVKVVNAAREDDDWKSLARTPLIIVVCVVVGDLLTGIVTG
jgi:hypothetical protein